MTKPIVQSVTLPASAKELYKMYLSPRSHGAFTGAPVVISSKLGSKFSAFGGMLSGRTLQTIPGQLIVQAWRSSNFHKRDIDSTLILQFSGVGKRGRIDLVHVNVPKQDHRGVSEGWKAYYWKPWRAYLARR